MKTIPEQIAELESQLSKAKSPVTQNILKAEIQKLKLGEKAEQGDQVSQAILLMKQVLDATKRNAGPGGVDKQEVEALVREMLKKTQISKDNLDSELKAYLQGNARVQLELETPTGTSTGSKISAVEYERQLFQNLLSDLVAMNNVYLYGPAGTGKTYIAEQLAEFMDWELVTLNCNQFTSQLDILGGQTVDGYQAGKLEMAWGNIDEKREPTAKKGAVLLLDELPKLDPNTAGILNAALAAVKNYRGGVPPVIQNGRNQKIMKKNLIIIGTGNVKLNEMSTEYEANFKQDLSLQDRFAGSTYPVAYDYVFETSSDKLMRNFLFIWIPLVKLREKIIEMRMTGVAFVSLRIMVNLKDTYITYRRIKEKLIDTAKAPYVSAINKPKTVVDGMNSFLSLFKPEQIQILKQAMNYDQWIKEVEARENLPMDKLNTPADIIEKDRIIAAYQATQAKII